ncbi:hypothetical protein [Glycomyces niveus]|uniref:Uncharacterized protein n=1 Tax=Glycomyces niveus TaxID=2820287 RepID=A0ABS3UA92_9ACTN|nr:hypothetical protein [Glycomyces sp. NEAU-S30]MBO3735704.1 hypothetical protein [Glycomyces sp. NEAU-S30]
MRFIAEHALPLGLTLTGALIALALVQFFFSPRDSKKFVASAMMLAFFILPLTFWFAANRGYIVEHDTTVADLVNEAPLPSVPTETGISEWKAAFNAFELVWPEEDTLQTERPENLISFDPETGGYYAGEGMQDGATLFAAIGFEGDNVDWFTCHAFGIRTHTTEDFLNTCWTAAAVTGADQVAGTEWFASVLAEELPESGQILSSSETICPANLTVTSLSSTETYLNMQFSITPAPDC